MGVYLNSKSAYGLFQRECASKYFVDKTEILSDLIKCVGTDFGRENRDLDIKYVAITRPRRFGKTVMANMIASYFGKGIDSHKEFDALKVAEQPWYKTHLNQHNVIHISFNKMPFVCHSYDQYIQTINDTLIDDISAAYPNIKIRDNDSAWNVLTKAYEYCEGAKFIFILDEWDYVYHQTFATDKDKDHFTRFLSYLLKDNAYVEMAYMTGILPIAKYSSGSELNMFCEYTMVSEEKYSECFGFTDREVDELYDRYRKGTNTEKKITREELRTWYDGYHTKSGERVYNPRSVVLALQNNNLGNYWTSSGPYDELFYYIGANVDSVKEDVGLLLSDIAVPARVREYAATSMELRTRDEIFSAMVVYGFLNYENGCVKIPNKELKNLWISLLSGIKE